MGINLLRQKLILAFSLFVYRGHLMSVSRQKIPPNFKEIFLFVKSKRALYYRAPAMVISDVFLSEKKILPER